MPYETIAGKVKRGTLCWADRWQANVTVACADRFAANSSSYLIVKVEWEPELENGEVEVRFRASSDNQQPRVRFDSAESEVFSKTLTENATGVYEIFAGAATPSEEVDLYLDIIVDGDKAKSFPLTVGTIETSVNIRQENGTDPVPAYILSGDEINLTATVEPDGTGQFYWFSTSQEALQVLPIPEPETEILLNATNSRLKGILASEVLGDRKICLLFKPEEGPAVMAAQPVSVIQARILVGETGNTELPHILGLNKTFILRAELSPASVLQTINWQITQGADKISFADGTDVSAAQITLNTIAVSAAAGDAELQLTFTTTLTAPDICINHSITVATIQLQLTDGSPFPRFLDLGEETTVRAVVQPDPLPNHIVWNVTTTEGSANANIETTAAAPTREAVVTGTATADTHEHEDALLTAVLAESATRMAESTLLEHLFTVIMRQPLRLFITLGEWTLGYTYGETGGAFRSHAAVKTTGNGEAIAASDGTLSMNPPATATVMGGPVPPVASIPAADEPLPTTVTLYLHLAEHLADNAQFSERASGLDNITGFAYLNIETASLETRLGSQLDAVTLPEGSGILNRGQRAALFVRGQITLEIEAGDIIAVASTQNAPAGERHLGFAVLNDHGQIDPAHSYNCMREFVTEGQPAVDQLLELIPVRWPVIDPALTPAEAIASTQNQLYPMSVLNDIRVGQGLNPAQWREVGNNQKALWRARLLKRSGHAPDSSTAAVFEFDDEDWQNLFQLEAITEFYNNFNDPWRPYLPRTTGENVPGNAVTVDFTSDWHVVIIDSFGTRDTSQLTGTAAVSEGHIVKLDSGVDLSRLTTAIDRIVLDTDRGRLNKEYLINSFDNEADTLMLDGTPDLVNNKSEWHIDLDNGGTLRGLMATVARDRIHLDIPPIPAGTIDQLSRVNKRFDTVYLPNDRIRPSKTYRILDINNANDIITIDGEPDLDGGQTAWYIPAGLSGELPALAYNLHGGPHAAIRGYDHFDGALFIIKDGTVRGTGPFRWNTYTKRHNVAKSQNLSSIRGNQHYDFASYRSGNAFKNYSFLVRDHGEAYDGVRENRFYFGREHYDTDYSVTPDSAAPGTNPVDGGPGKTEIRLHFSINNGAGCSSAGCVVSPVYYAFRQLMVQLYQVDYAAAHGGANNADINQIGNATTRPASEALYNANPAGTLGWRDELEGNLWIVRPNERPLSMLHFTLRWPDSRHNDRDFAGTPITLNVDRLPYLHTTEPTSYQQTIELANTAEAQILRPGVGPGEFDPRVDTEMAAGTDYYLIIPDHVFVHVTQSEAAVPWRRRFRFHDVEPGAHRSYGLRVRIVGGQLRVTPVDGAETDWGDTRRIFRVVALIPYLRAVETADLTEDWHRATRDLRMEFGEYPDFNESTLEFHKPLAGANLAAAQTQHLAPGEFYRFPAVSERSYTDLSGHIYLEQFLWKEQTLTGNIPPQALRYMPLSKRTFLAGMEALRAAFDADEEFIIRTGFVPPNKINDSHTLRTVNGQSGYRINQIRHMFGDAADIDRSEGNRFNLRANRVGATNILLPWPDTAVAQALRDHFSHMQFERLMLNTDPTTIDRRYVLHLDRRDYDIGFPAGVYQFRINDIRAVNGDQTVFNDFTTSHIDYADIVTVVPQAGATRPNAFYDSNLNAAPPHGHPVFNVVDPNPNLDALLTRMDGANMWATINLGLRNVGHDVDVEAVIQEVFDTFRAHNSFIGIAFDLEWYNVAGLNATNAVQNLARWIRANHAGKYLFPIWFGATVGRLNWPAIQPVSDVVIPIYDGAPGTPWGNAVRNTWKGFMLNNSVLEHVYDSNRNIRNYGHNMLIPSHIPNADFEEALNWLGRTSRLYGSTNFAFQFNNYGQNYATHSDHLQDILDELQA